MPSKQDSLSREDMMKWARNVAIFFSPSLIIFLGLVQNGTPIVQALPALYGGLIAALIDLLRKFSAGSNITTS